MTESEQKELRNYCAYILKEYGFAFPPTDPVIPALYVIHREIMRNKRSNETLARLIQDTVRKVDPTIYNFNEPGEAWKFKFADSLKWLFVGLSGVLLLCGGFFWWSETNELDHAKMILKKSGQIETSLLNRIKKDDDDFLYLEFEKASGNSVRNFYEYDQVNDRFIRVYIGRAK